MSARKPRIGLILDRLKGLGGVKLSSLRHGKLLADKLEVIPITLEESGNEEDWLGRVKKVEQGENRAYRIFAANFLSDRFAGDLDQQQRTYAEQIVRIAAEEQLDAIHVYGAFYQRPLVGAFAAVRADLPLIISFRGVDLDIRIFRNNIGHMQAALNAAKACVCVNQSAQKLLGNLFQVNCPIFVIHNHVNPEDFPPDQPDAVELPGKSPRIGCFGEFRRVMGLDFLLNAFEELAQQRSLSLILVGPFRPFEAPYYNGFIDKLNHSQSVFRLGSVEHDRVLGYMKACDLLVFPSFSDGSPNKVLEAMVTRKPIVASRVGGIREMIRDGIDGKLVDPYNPNELVEAIALLLDRPEIGLDYGNNAYLRATSEFAPSKEREAWLECYREIGICL